MYKTLNILIFEVNSAGDLSVSHCESFFLAQEHYRAKNKAVSRLLDLIADWTFRYPGVTLFNSSPETYKLNLQRLWRLLSDSLVIKHDFALTFCSALNAYIFFSILKYLSLQVFIRIMNIVFFLVFLRPQVFRLQLFIVIDYKYCNSFRQIQGPTGHPVLSLSIFHFKVFLTFSMPSFVLSLSSVGSQFVFLINRNENLTISCQSLAGFYLSATILQLFGCSLFYCPERLNCLICQ